MEMMRGDKLEPNSECRIQAPCCASKCTQTRLIGMRRRYPPASRRSAVCVKAAENNDRKNKKNVHRKREHVPSLRLPFEESAE